MSSGNPLSDHPGCACWHCRYTLPLLRAKIAAVEAVLDGAETIKRRALGFEPADAVVSADAIRHALAEPDRILALLGTSSGPVAREDASRPPAGPDSTLAFYRLHAVEEDA